MLTSSNARSSKARKELPIISKFFAVATTSTLLFSCANQFPSGGGAGVDVDVNQAVKVAVLLPSGGTSAGLNQIGADMRKAIELALNDRGTGIVEIQYYETGGSEVQAASMAQQAQNNGATLIIGPLKSTEAAAVGTAVSLPVFAFTNNSEVAQGNVYATGTTFEVLSERIMDFASKNGSRAIGIVRTQDLGGEQAARALTASANNNGLSIVSNSSYPLSIESIEQAAPAIAASLNSNGADSVALSDVPSGGLSFIAQSLDASGINARNTKFYGISKWDAVGEIAALPALQGGYFVAPNPSATQSFTARLGGAHDLASLAYDNVSAAISLVEEARSSRDSSPFSPSDISEASFRGALGDWRFVGNIADRATVVMQINSGSAVIVDGPKLAY